MKLTDGLTKLQNVCSRRNYKKSYSQCGEDLIVDHILAALRIPNPSYLDIGAHHPIFLNNTYLFYQKGCSGVCVEPDPLLWSEIRKKRKRDICLNVAVGVTNESKGNFYILTHRALSTLSKGEAERIQGYGNQKIELTIQIPLVSVNQIIEQNFASSPNFISLDVEGIDFAVLKTFDFSAFRPEVFCIETLTYTEDNSEQKLSEIIDFMINRDYFVYGDTYINSICVDEKVWKSRR